MQSIIDGIVANSQDDAPIQDGRVTLSTAGSEEVRLEAVRGHDGRFQMNIRGSGRYTLRSPGERLPRPIPPTGYSLRLLREASKRTS